MREVWQADEALLGPLQQVPSEPAEGGAEMTVKQPNISMYVMLLVVLWMLPDTPILAVLLWLVWVRVAGYLQSVRLEAKP